MEEVLSSQILLIADKNLRITEAQESACVAPSRAMQVTELGDLVGKSLAESIPGLDRAEALDACETILSGGRFPGGFAAYRKALTLFEPDPERRVILLSPHSTDGGAPGVICRVSRIFLKHPQFDELHLEDFKTIVENCMEFMVLVDQLGFHTYISPIIQTTMGARPEEVPGIHMSEVQHPDDVETCQAQLDQAARDGLPVAHFQYRLLMPDASVRHMVISGRRLEIAGHVRYLVVARDITETMELRQKLQARQEALGVLSNIVLTLSQVGNINDALKLALREILSFLGLPHGGIMVISPDGSEYIASGMVGSDRPLLPAGQFMRNIDAVCPGSGCIEVISDVATDSRIDEELRERVLALGVQSFALMRLRSTLGQHACIALAAPASGQISVEQMEFLDLANGILGPAIENAVLQMELADRANRLAMLERMALSINSGLDVPSVFTACQAGLRELIDCDDVCLVVFCGNEIADIYYCPSGGELIHNRKKLSRQDSRTLRSMQETHAWTDPAGMQSYRMQHKEREITSGSVAVSPLVYKGTVTGLVKIWSQKEGVFGQREGSILQAVAEHLAIAVANARLHEAEHARTLELEALGREMQHRIKNNLQTIAGLLSISSQAGEQSTRALERCMGQISAISTVHSLLTPRRMATGVRLRKMLTEVAETAVAATGRSEAVRVAVEGRDCGLSPDIAIALGVIVNELVSNAVEHGLAARDAGAINIRTSIEEQRTVVELSDNGIGLPKGFKSPRKARSGLGLVSSLVEHGLHGRFAISATDSGTIARIEF